MKIQESKELCAWKFSFLRALLKGLRFFKMVNMELSTQPHCTAPVPKVHAKRDVIAAPSLSIFFYPCGTLIFSWYFIFSFVP